MRSLVDSATRLDVDLRSSALGGLDQARRSEKADCHPGEPEFAQLALSAASAASSARAQTSSGGMPPLQASVRTSDDVVLPFRPGRRSRQRERSSRRRRGRPAGPWSEPRPPTPPAYLPWRGSRSRSRPGCARHRPRPGTSPTPAPRTGSGCRSRSRWPDRGWPRPASCPSAAERPRSPELAWL